MGNLTALRPEDVSSLYTPKDAEYQKLYEQHLAQRRKETLPNGSLKYPWKFETVKGFFKQSDPKTDEYSFNYLTSNFGLEDKYTWKSLQAEIHKLNENSPENVQYKVLFLARHGQGFHNFAIIKYGQKAWDEKYSKLNGDDEITWGPDPFLTQLGVNQAKENHKAWNEQLSKGAPIPSKFYVSPFTRSIQTLVNTWKGIVDYKMVVKEEVRETIGVHTCDKRSSKTIIKQRFEGENLVFEPGFEEEDIYYKDDYRETIWEQTLRINSFLNYLYETDKNDEFVNVTSHSGSIRSFIMAINHRNFAIGTGGMIPVVIKGTKIQ